jgi:hypothetical protein
MEITSSPHPNGNLEMTADILTQKYIRDLRHRSSSEITAEGTFIVEILTPLGFEQVAPEEVGALTSAPIISDGTDIYGYMDYQIRNFLEELANGHSVTWIQG